MATAKAAKATKAKTALTKTADKSTKLSKSPAKNKALVAAPKKSTALKSTTPGPTSPKASQGASKKPAELVEQYRTHKTDTGSTAVQIAQLSDQILELQKHLKKHAHDHDSRRGLLIMVGKRRKLLNYLGRGNAEGYAKLIADLKLRK